MQQRLFALPLIVASVAATQAQPAPNQTTDPAAVISTATHYVVLRRKNDSRTWARNDCFTNELGAVICVTNSAYTELEIGMHRPSPVDGSLIECDSRITILPNGGAAATNVANPLYLPGSLYND